jgi:hypothetical protein
VDAGTFAANWDRVFGSAGDTGAAALPEGSMPADSRHPDTFTERRLVCDIDHATGVVSNWREETVAYRVEKPR